MRRPNNIAKSFLDVLFNILMGFFLLLMLALVLINPEAKNKDIELRAEVLITMEWPGDALDDVDLMVRTPQGEIVFYGKRDIKSANLDRDDRGTVNDRIRMEDGSYHIIKENWEHVTLRKLFPGEYVVNAYAFNKVDKLPTEVTITVERLNPRHRTIYKETKTLHHKNEELTFVRFTVDGKGKIISVDTTEESFRGQLQQR